MNDTYSLSDSFREAESMWPAPIHNFAKEYVGGHYMISFVLIIVLTAVLIWMIVMNAEGFNPTNSMRMQQRDGTGEGMEDNRGKSAFAQLAQSGGSAPFVADPNAKPNQPGSLAWHVLHSDEYNCNKRKDIGDDAWGWMNGVANESMADKPKTDNDFSQILAGQ